jgi:uracil-DNA glycosylase
MSSPTSDSLAEADPSLFVSRPASKPKKVEEKSGLKRQRSLNTFFTKTPTSESSNKKAKFSTASTSSSKTFDRKEFIDSLTEEQKRLLKLELNPKYGIEKSWLQLGLAEEIKKPYFLELKKFLKSEGVGDGEGKEPGKIYPPGE